MKIINAYFYLSYAYTIFYMGISSVVKERKSSKMADMFNENEMTADLYTLVDEEGVEQTFEMIDVLEVNSERYYALVPYYDDPSEELEADGELVILKSEYDENDEEILASIEDDAEYERIGNMFLERLNEALGDED